MFLVKKSKFGIREQFLCADIRWSICYEAVSLTGSGLKIRRESRSSIQAKTRKEYFNESLLRLACNKLSNNDSHVNEEKAISYHKNMT